MVRWGACRQWTAVLSVWTLTLTIVADAHNGQAFDLACVQLKQEQGIVFVPFACAKLDSHGAHIGRFHTSLQGSATLSTVATYALPGRLHCRQSWW